MSAFDSVWLVNPAKGQTIGWRLDGYLPLAALCPTRNLIGIQTRTLIRLGALLWPLCRQWQHLRQHNRDEQAHTSVCTHTLTYITAQTHTAYCFWDGHTHTHTRSHFVGAQNLSVSLSPPCSHTQCSLSLPKASGLWSKAIHSLLKAILCRWQLKATTLRPFGPFVFQVCVCKCATHVRGVKITVYLLSDKW